MANKKWTKEDIEWLKDNYIIHGLQYCADKLERSPNCVKSKASTLKLNSINKINQEEIDFLKDYYFEYGPEYCAEKLDRTQGSVKGYAHRLGLKCKRRYIQLLSKEYLIEEYVNKFRTAVDIATENNLNHHTVIKYLNKFGIEVRTKGDYFGSNHSSWKGCGELSARMFGAIKYGADSRDLAFEITIEFIWDLFEKQNRKCAISGREIVFSSMSSKNQNDTTASLDRINSSLGYLEDNIQWVHKDVNKMKWDMSEDDFIQWCCDIAKYRGGALS